MFVVVVVGRPAGWSADWPARVNIRRASSGELAVFLLAAPPPAFPRHRRPGAAADGWLLFVFAHISAKCELDQTNTYTHAPARPS
jgi:hypothetical protein